jgi:hypothetical protein
MHKAHKIKIMGFSNAFAEVLFFWGIIFGDKLF